MKKLALFASGEGSNAQHITEYFAQSTIARVALIVCSNNHAPVIERARKLNLPCVVLSKNEFSTTPSLLEVLKKYEIDFIVLAGFLWLIPAYLINAYRGRICNIHPSLLPLFGGKGMYGMKVHEAVILSGANESGITIHWVSEHYDEGAIIFQARCEVTTNDTAATLAEKIHQLEHKHFPTIIEQLIA